MIKEGVYTLGHLARLIAEAGESRPVVGAGVAAANARNNRKAADDILKGVKGLSGGDEKNSRPANTTADLNKSLLDLNFVTPPPPGYNERVKALALGYNSAAEMKKHLGEKDEAREGAREFYRERGKAAKRRNKNKKSVQTSGIQSQHWDPSLAGENTVFGESRALKRLNFKNTVFLNEEQALRRVPDAYKTDGNRFIMKDGAGNEFLIECRVDSRFGHTSLNVVNKYNKKKLNEQLDRMRRLYDYNGETVCGAVERNNNDASMESMLDTVRGRTALK